MVCWPAINAFSHRACARRGSGPVLHDVQLGKHSLRAATVTVAAPEDTTDTLTITVAETLRARHLQAREILLLATLMQALLLICVLLLVWFGVSRGLRVLDPLAARLAARSHELTPIGGPDVPEEILPLTRTIDALFGRLRARWPCTTGSSPTPRTSCARR